MLCFFGTWAHKRVIDQALPSRFVPILRDAAPDWYWRDRTTMLVLGLPVLLFIGQALPSRFVLMLRDAAPDWYWLDRTTIARAWVAGFALLVQNL